MKICADGQTAVIQLLVSFQFVFANTPKKIL